MNSTFGPLRLTGQNVSVIENAAMDLGVSNIGNNLTVRANLGSITNSGALVVGGNSIFRADANGADIILNNAGNDFTGTVEFQGGNLRDVTVFDTTAFDIGQLILTRALNVTSLVAITDSGALTVPGISTFNAVGNDITLDEALSTFGPLSFIGDDVEVVENAAMDLGASTITGTLTASATGDITDSGTLIITGASDFDAGVNDITLDDMNSTFGPLMLEGNDVSVIENGAMDLGLSTIGNDFTVRALMGDITSSGPLAVVGDSIFRADDNPASIILDDVGNDFTGTVTFQGVNLQDVTVVDTTDFDISINCFSIEISCDC